MTESDFLDSRLLRISVASQHAAERAACLRAEAKLLKLSFAAALYAFRSELQKPISVLEAVSNVRRDGPLCRDAGF